MKTLHQAHFDSVDRVSKAFASVDYIASREIATSVYLGFNLEKPILVEGPAGVGKTELAKGMAEILDVPLIRMQCYEGLDESKGTSGNTASNCSTRNCSRTSWAR